MKRYYKILLIFTKNSVQISLSSRFNAFILVAGKLIRFGMFFFFILIIGAKTKLIAGYTLPQIMLFYLTYQLIDTLPQMLMRGTYKFRGVVVRGDFDYYLVKPMSSLFRALFSEPDILDIPMTVISICAVFALAYQSGNLTVERGALYILLVANAIVIAAAFHIFVVSIGIITTEVDNAITLYRDITQMGRLPVSIYKEPLKGFLTFVVPVTIMMTVPAQAMLGLLSVPFLIISFAMSALLLIIGILFWIASLKWYTSASS